MTKRHRTILFFVFCFLFVLIAPPAILYSQGYVFDFEKKRIVQTGALFVETNIGNVEIYLSGKLKGKTGTVFKNAFKKNLSPKIYQIELRKTGYHSWKKNLEIKEKLTTEIKNVFLLPENPQKEMVLEKEGQNFFISPNERKIACISLDNKLELFNLASHNSHSILEATEIDQVLWAIDSKSLFFKAWAGKKMSYFVWQEDEQTLINLNKSFKNLNNPLEFKWHPKDSTQIYFLDQEKDINSLYKIDLLNKGVLQKILKNIKTYEIFDDGIYWLEEVSGLLFKTDFEGKSRQQLTLSSPQNYSEKNDYKLFVFYPQISLKDNSDNFYFLDEKAKTFEKIGENIKEAKLSKDSKKLLYYGENEIWVLYLGDILVQPFRYKGDKELIGRFAASLDATLWCPDSEHLLINTRNLIKIIELDGRDVRNTIDFLKGKSPCYKESSGKLYFFDQGKLWSAKF